MVRMHYYYETDSGGVQGLDGVRQGECYTKLMRLDLYLKKVRLVKRRTLAQALCSRGRVAKNGKVAKPSTAVEVGCELTLRFAQRTLVVSVLALPTRPAGNLTEAAQYWHTLSDTRTTEHQTSPMDTETHALLSLEQEEDTAPHDDDDHP